MEFELGRAIASGIVGAAAMTMVTAMGASMMGMKMDMPMTLGTMLLPPGKQAWTLGLMLHLMMGAVFFVAYAALFRGLGLDSGIVGWSALFGAIHAIVAGMAFGMMPAMHPRMTTEPATHQNAIPAPGIMGLNMGTMAPMAIVLAHVVFGVVAGAIYAA